MSGRLRAALFALVALVLAGGWVAAAADLPDFGGTTHHPYGVRALERSEARQTSNAVASVSFDQRGFDTLGEEFILVMAVLGTTLVLRRQADEEEEQPEEGEESSQAPRNPPTADVVRLVGYLMLPITLLIGGYVVAHGHLSPGGGFQGGVVLATGLHLLYLAGDYPTLERLRPTALFEVVESAGATGYAAIGLIGLLSGSAYLANTLPLGTAGQLLSAGTVELLQAVVGFAVTGGMVLLLTEFLEQTLVVRPDEDG